MDIQKKELGTPEEYTDFVRGFATLLDKQLTVYEKRAADGNLHDLALSMPAIISLVNTAGYLRGQDGMFLDIRPRTESQSEFYGYEDMFEKRLDALITVIMASDEKQNYLERIKGYFVTARSGRTNT